MSCLMKVNTSCRRGRNVIGCIPELHNKLTYYEPEAVDSFSLGDALTAYHPILEAVFEHLPIADLQVVKKIHPVWKQASEREIKRRVAPASLTLCKELRCGYYKIDDNFFFTNTQLSIVTFKKHIGHLRNKLCIHNSSSETFSIPKYITREVLQPGSRCCLLECFNTYVLSEKDPLDKVESIIYTCINIPYIPNIRVVLDYCDPIRCFNDMMKENEVVRCLLLFCRNSCSISIQKALIDISEKQDIMQVAIGGGITCKVQTAPSIRNISDRMVCMAFLEDTTNRAAFDAFSIIIEHNAKEESQKFRDKVLTFKKNAVLRRHGILFDFCCAQCWSSKKVRKPMYEQCFGEYTIVSYAVNGEFGFSSHKCANMNDGASKPSRPKKTKTMYNQNFEHVFTTSLVFITWGPKV